MKILFLKTSLVTALILTTFGARAQAAAAATNAPVVQKIATIDLRRTFDSYYKTQQADSGLKEQAGEIDKQRLDMVEKLRAKEDEFKELNLKANDQAISATERSRAREAAERKFNELKQDENSIKQFLASNQERLREQQRRLRDRILGEIQELVNARAKEGGYALVLDTAAETVNNTKVIVFTAGEHDLTDGVLTQLNASAPAGFKPVPRDTAAPAPLVPDNAR